MTTGDRRYYILRTVPAGEFRAEDELRAAGALTILPREYRWRRYGAKKVRRKVAYPILPRYVFAGFVRVPNWHELKDSDYLQGPMGLEPGKPAILTPSDIATLQRLDTAGLLTGETQWTRDGRRSLKPGDSAEVAEGALAGSIVRIDAIVAKKAQVMARMLGQMRLVTIPLDALEPV